MTTLRNPNGNCVAALQPAPGDLFTVTLLGGKIVFVRSADEYEQVLRFAESVAGQVAPPGGRPYTLKVIGMTLDEVLAFAGISRDDFAAGLKVGDAELRDLARRTCREVLLRSNDGAVRAEAMDLLTEMGALTQ